MVVVSNRKAAGRAAADEQPPAKERVYRFEDLAASGISLCVGEDALKSDDCMHLLGWTTDAAEAVRLGCPAEPLFDTFRFGIKGSQVVLKEKVWCHKNIHNRPLRMSKVEELVQKHLNRDWEFNGESIIIGEHEGVLNGQHSLISLVLAEKVRWHCCQHGGLGRGAEWWADNWPNPVTMEKLVVLGVRETDTVVNTLDTAEPRTFSDVLFRSQVFAKASAGERKVLSRMTEWAVKLLWHRTGCVDNPYSPRRTHEQGAAWIAAHPRLVDAVQHVYTEYKGGGGWAVNGKLLSPGAAAGLLYLMAVGKSDGDAYLAAEQPNEGLLDVSLFDRACDFWTGLCGSPSYKVVRDALGALDNTETGQRASMDDRMAVIINAWTFLLHRPGSPPTRRDLKIIYTRGNNEHDPRPVYPVLSGIDLGGGKHERADLRQSVAASDGVAAADGDDSDPVPEEAEAVGLPEPDAVVEDQPAEGEALEAAEGAEEGSAGEGMTQTDDHELPPGELEARAAEAREATARRDKLLAQRAARKGNTVATIMDVDPTAAAPVAAQLAAANGAGEEKSKKRRIDRK